MKSLLTPFTFLSLASIGLAQTTVTLDGASGSQTYNVVRTTDGGLSLGLEFEVQYLLVGGGGAGGATATSTDGVDGTGGGGAGGFLEGAVARTNQSYNLTVGAGGAGTVRGVGNGENGGNTTFSDFTASGGGGGGGYALTGNSGGSGGGGGGRQNVAGGSGTTGQGFSGGRAQSENVTGQAAGGGGGGAGGAGQAGNTNEDGGDGGIGKISTITGQSIYYAGGGGGAGIASNGDTQGVGGLGGGGNAARTGAGGAGTNGLGGGGGGVGNDGPGGAGGSGIVIVRYRGDAAGTGGTVTAGSGSADGYTLHTFTTTGASSLDLSALNLNTRLGAVQTGVIDGSGDLTFTGPGKLTLDAANTFTGTTRVTAGTLALGSSGSIATSAGLSLATGASFDVTDVSGGFTLGSSQALSGGGSVLGNTTIAGIHSPGFSPGLQSFEDNLTYASGASIVWELGSSTTADRGIAWDAIDVTGDLTFSGPASLLLDFNPAASGSFTGSTVDWTDSLWASALGTNGAGWKIFDVSGTVTGLENLSIAGSPWLDAFGGNFSTSLPNLEFELYEYAGGVYVTTVDITPVPEPGSLLALAGLLGGGLSLRRRKA